MYYFRNLVSRILFHDDVSFLFVLKCQLYVTLDFQARYVSINIHRITILFFKKKTEMVYIQGFAYPDVKIF